MRPVRPPQPLRTGQNLRRRREREIGETSNDRVIWGSNWPDAGIAMPTPNDADLLDFLLDAVPEENDRRLILSDNPAQLCGWPTP